MAFVREVKRKVRAAVPPMLFLSLVAYFGWNAIQGDRGLMASAQRQEVLRARQQELARAETDRDTWERRVAALRGNRIDRDMLDERAREMLNRANPDDVIVLFGPRDRLF